MNEEKYLPKGIHSPEIDSENERRKFVVADFTKNGKIEVANSKDIFAKLDAKIKAEAFETDMSAAEIEQQVIEKGAYRLGTGNGHLTLARSLAIGDDPPPPSNAFKGSMLFKIQNIHDLLDSYPRDDKIWEPDNIFCARLPYYRSVLTYDHDFIPPELGKEARRTGIGKITRHMNVIMEKATRKDVLETCKASALSERDTNEVMHIIDRREPDELIRTYIAADGRAFPGVWYTMIDETGHVLTDKVHDQNWIWLRDPEATSRIHYFHDMFGEQMQDGFARHGMICLNAIQFLNCRNVEIIDNPPTRQQRRQAEREGKAAPVTYKTLVIHAMKRVNANSAPGESRGGGMPVHTVRGHFKDFRSGPGLGRGHAHGIYWWDPCVKGNPIHGRVEKDYEVEAGTQ